MILRRLNFKLSVLSLVLSAQVVFSADTLLLNGHIYTANAKAPWVEALAVTGD